MNPKFILTAIIVIAAIYFGTRSTDAPTTSVQPAVPATQPASSQPAASQPAIGGAFSLTTQDGEPYTEQQLKGHYSLVFFGFTHCPDMCPMAMSHITTALEQLPDATAQRITPLLISVDPARDTPEVMKAYTAAFHPQLIGLTGTQEQVDAAAAAFKVYHQRMEKPDGNYLVNHSGFIYLLDTEGQFLRHFSYDTAPDALAAALQQAVSDTATP